MSQSTEATNDYDPLHDLSSRHLLALDALDSGATHEQAAERAGVHRVTVTNWSTKHPAFIAERNRRRHERARLFGDRIDAITSRAVEVVGSAIESGDVGAAFTWLKQTGLDRPEQFGSTDSVVVLDRIADRTETDQMTSMLGGGMLSVVKAELREEFQDDEAWRSVIPEA